MHADIQGALNQIDRSWKAFVHNGQKMSKEQVKAVLKYGVSKGYKSTAEFNYDNGCDDYLEVQKNN